MEALNHHQMVIVNNLTFKEKARFAELNTEQLTTDQFNYHLKALMKHKIIEKDEENFYALTFKGRSFSSDTDIYNLKIEKQSKIHVAPVCIKMFGKQKKYLLHRRTKHPYFGWMGIPTGKTKWGHSYEDEVIRELEEETGLTGNPTLKVILHSRMKLRSTDKIEDDRVFYYYRIDDIQNELITKTIEGENYWLSIDEIKSEKNIFPDTLWILEGMEKDGIVFKEVVESYDNF